MILLLGSAVGAVLFFIPVFVIFVIVLATYSSPNVLPGVELAGPGIDPIQIGDLSPADVQTRLNGIAVNAPITLQDGTRTWTFAAATLGVKIDVNATIDAATQAGRGDLAAAVTVMLSGKQIAPIYTLDMVKAQAALTSLSNTVNTKPTADPLAVRRILNVGATLDRFPPTLSALFSSPVIVLVMDQQQGPHTLYTVERGEELNLIAKKFNVPVMDIISLNKITDPDQIYPGQQLTIPAAGIWQPTEKDAPPAPLATGKAIVVGLAEQRIYAYQDGHLVHSTLMSSGLPGHGTIQGDFHVYVKYPSTRMTGPGYDIPDVPWTMYFYQGYGIHGAYWHNAFGREMSHGCVNLDTTEAKWFYDFSPVGTLVRVIPT